MKFTDGKMEKLSEGFYNLTLFHNGKQVYKVTLPTADAVKIIEKHSGKIKML